MVEAEKIYKEVSRHDPLIMHGIKEAPVYKKRGL